MNYREIRDYFEEFERPEDDILSRTEQARTRAFRERQKCYELKYDFLTKDTLSYDQAIRILQTVII